MKITRISSIVVNARMRNWIFVKVETDQQGLYGWGEATLEWKTKGVVGAVEDIGRLLIGEDPNRIEHLYQMMTRQYFWRAGIEGMSAISGIDMALWDIKGKALGVPVYELLGGRVRDRVRLYNHLGGGQMKVMYESTEPQQFAENALSVKAAGYTAIKFMAVPRTEPVEGVQSVKYAAKLVEAIREAVGAGDGSDGRSARPHLAGDGDPVLPRPGAVWTALLRRALPDRGYRGDRAGDAGVEHSDRHRRAAGWPPAVPGSLRKARLPHHPARSLALRRTLGSAQDRGDGGNLFDRRRPAQSERTGRHRRRDPLRARDAELADPGSRSPTTSPGATK